MSRRRKLSVALVYPPFGPAGLPSLGLSLFAATFRAEQRPTRVDYWNLAVLAALPFPSVWEKDLAFRRLSTGALFPWNEWAYRRAAYGVAPSAGELAQVDALGEADARLVRSLEAGAEADVAERAALLAEFDVVGIASTFHQITAAAALARALKAQRLDVITVLGGANADGPMAAANLRLHPAFDFALAGEADRAFPNLLAVLEGEGSFDQVPGLVRREPGRVVEGAAPQPVKDLDALSPPDFSDYIRAWTAAGLDGPNRLALAMESSRGCWWGQRNHCTFCGLNANGMDFRQKNFDRFVEEVETVLNRHEGAFLFMADNILALDYVKAFDVWAQDSAALARGRDYEFFYEIKANLTRDQVDHMAEAGVTTVQPGIESFSTPVLRLMRKGLRGIQNLAFLRYAADAGLRPVYNILWGFPGEAEADVRAMIAVLPQFYHLFPPTSAPRVEFHRFSPYHNRPADYGLTLRPDPRYAAIFPFAEADVAELAYRFVAEDAETPRYFADLAAAVSRWRAAFADGARMTCSANAAGMVVTDTRDPGRARRTLLMGYAATVHAALDRPNSASGLGRVPADAAAACAFEQYLEAVAAHADLQVIWFDEASFSEAPEAALELMTDAGVLYREADPEGRVLYMALATRPQPARQLSSLERLGI